MTKRLFALMLLVLLVSMHVVSAQEDGSTLAAWADSSASAFNMNEQVEWPLYRINFSAINTYTAVNEPVLSCFSGHQYSLWHTFVAPQTGEITIFATGSNYNSVIGVYKNTPSAANQIRCQNNIPDFSSAEAAVLNVKAGTRYYVMFAAAGAGAGVDSTSTLAITYAANILSHFQIPPTGNYSNIQNHLETSFQTWTSPNPSCAQPEFSVLYRFRPRTSGRYEFSTVGSSFDTVMFVIDQSNSAVCSDNISTVNMYSRLRPTLVGGQVYAIMIGQSTATVNRQTDNLTLSLRVRKL